MGARVAIHRTEQTIHGPGCGDSDYAPLLLRWLDRNSSSATAYKSYPYRNDHGDTHPFRANDHPELYAYDHTNTYHYADTIRPTISDHDTNHNTITHPHDNLHCQSHFYSNRITNGYAGPVSHIYASPGLASANLN